MLSHMLRFAALTGFGLLATAGYAATKPSVPASASPSAKQPAKPVWPNNGIAQRRFPRGGVMFVENDHGKPSAWVLSYYTRSMLIDKNHAHAQALNFFTGKVMKVKVWLEDDGSEDSIFTDPNGVVHAGGDDPRFQFSGTEMDIALPGIRFYGQPASLGKFTNPCSVLLDATMPISYTTGEKPLGAWVRYPVYHQSPYEHGCRSGSIHSLITSAVDLGDGTILADEGCFVFRLTKSDLSPVGSAPALTVVDASTLKAAIATAKGKKIKDATAYLIKALHLPTAPDVSCKED